MAAKKDAIKTSGVYKGKSNQLGMGGRFAQMKDKIMAEGKSADSAERIAASIGRKKLGADRMADLAAKGRKRKS